MNKQKQNKERKDRRKLRVRSRVFGTAKRPRLSVFRGLRNMHVQLIDDTSGKTLLSASTKELKEKRFTIDTAKKLGELVAKKAQEAGIGEAAFDKSAYKFHGKVKALADAAREKGLTI